MNWLLSTKTVKIIAWIYTGVILLLVTLPLNGDDQFLGKLNHNYVLQIRFDYISHALMFIPWILVIGYGWELQRKNKDYVRLTFLLSLAFSIICEYIQLLLPYRTFNINDLIANGLGVSVGYLLLILWTKRTNKNQSITK